MGLLRGVISLAAYGVAVNVSECDGRHTNNLICAVQRGICVETNRIGVCLILEKEEDACLTPTVLGCGGLSDYICCRMFEVNKHKS